jgi:hypothetical protein
MQTESRSDSRLNHVNWAEAKKTPAVVSPLASRHAAMSRLYMPNANNSGIDLFTWDSKPHAELFISKTRKLSTAASASSSTSTPKLPPVAGRPTGVQHKYPKTALW